jgi:hypothetical protein
VDQHRLYEVHCGGRARSRVGKPADVATVQVDNDHVPGARRCREHHRNRPAVARDGQRSGYPRGQSGRGEIDTGGKVPDSQLRGAADIHRPRQRPPVGGKRHLLHIPFGSVDPAQFPGVRVQYAESGVFASRVAAYEKPLPSSSHGPSQ